MKKLIGFLTMAVLAFTLVGCDINVSREGNKVFIGMNPNAVYEYAKKAQKHFGLKVTAEDPATRTLNTQVTSTTALNRYGSALVDLAISENNQNSIITVSAKINGDYDEQKSGQAAQEIVDRIIAYFNTFGTGTNK